LEFAYFSKYKLDFSLKREDLLREALHYSLLLGHWEKYCEICIELDEWEKAIMAAPHVSLAYWKDLTVRYSQLESYKSKEAKKFSALLSNEEHPSINLCLENNENEYAKVLWLTRKNKESNFN
jgi:hypothetical protein